tara:strand:+ start:712 stop:1155 length:444 start_codon:yes stop_codon:yes gene_type:complete
MKKLIQIIFIFFFINACGFQPLLVKSNNFSFNNLDVSGDKDVSGKIKKSLIKFKDENSQINLRIINSLNKNIISKNEKGDPEVFLINLKVEILVKDGQDLKTKKIFRKNLTYNNKSNKFKLKQYEKKLITNLIDNISYDILNFLNSI